MLCMFLCFALTAGNGHWEPCFSLRGPCEARLKPAIPTEIDVSKLLASYLERPKRMDFKVVVSIATFPGRRHIDLPIGSMLNQSYAPDFVVVSIPRRVARLQISGSAEASATLLHQRWGERVKVKLLDRDYGPASKLLAVLQDDEYSPDTLVITLDDDIGYHHDTVLALALSAEALAQAPLMDPARMRYAVVFSSEGVWRDDFGRYETRIHDCKSVDAGEIEPQSFPRGVSGVGYRVGWFDIGIFHSHDMAPKGCFIHDDVFIGGNLYNLGIKVFQICSPFSSTFGGRENGELSVNSAHWGNTQQMGDCLAHFGFGAPDGSLQFLKGFVETFCGSPHKCRFNVGWVGGNLPWMIPLFVVLVVVVRRNRKLAAVAYYVFMDNVLGTRTHSEEIVKRQPQANHISAQEFGLRHD